MKLKGFKNIKISKDGGELDLEDLMKMSDLFELLGERKRLQRRLRGGGYQGFQRCTTHIPKEEEQLEMVEKEIESMLNE